MAEKALAQPFLYCSVQNSYKSVNACILPNTYYMCQLSSLINVKPGIQINRQ